MFRISFFRGLIRIKRRLIWRTLKEKTRVILEIGSHLTKRLSRRVRLLISLIIRNRIRSNKRGLRLRKGWMMLGPDWSRERKKFSSKKKRCEKRIQRVWSNFRFRSSNKKRIKSFLRRRLILNKKRISLMIALRFLLRRTKSLRKINKN